jgi:hypothetical protein
LFVLQRLFFRLTETSGVDSGIFGDRNFGISNPHEVSNEFSVERKPEQFSKFRWKINYCVCWLLVDLACGLDFEPKDPRFNLQTAQKQRKKIHCPTRQSEISKDILRNKKLNSEAPLRKFELRSDSMDRSSTLQISTEANGRSSGELKPAEKNELQAKNKNCESFGINHRNFEPEFSPWS